ncbi:MAG: ABC transporter permease [Thermoplasmata archaeon]
MENFSLTALRYVIKYELIWNIRKAKLYFVLALVLALSFIVTYFMARFVTGISAGDFWYVSLTELSSWFFLLLIASTISMNTISGEFESGSILPLLSKPISREEIYFGKYLAIAIIVLLELLLLSVSLVVFSYILKGAPSDVWKLGVLWLAITLSALVYAAFTMMLSSVSKNSIVALMGTFGVLFGMTIAVGIYSIMNSSPYWFSFFPFLGTDGVMYSTYNAMSTPNAYVNNSSGFGKASLLPWTYLQYTGMEVLLSVIYVVLFLFIGFYYFNNSDIKES